jgi:putative flippase GtrA
MCKCRARDVREIPIHFATRARGESKLTIKQQFKYLEHLSRLYDFFYPRASPVAKFLIVTLIGWSVGLVLYEVVAASGANRVAAVVFGYFSNILVAAVFHSRYVRTQREFLVTPHPWIEFGLTALAEILTCVVVALWCTARLAHPELFDLPVVCFLAATMVRYILRKEFMQDIRGLRRDPRSWEWRAASGKNIQSQEIPRGKSPPPR